MLRKIRIDIFLYGGGQIVVEEVQSVLSLTGHLIGCDVANGAGTDEVCLLQFLYNALKRKIRSIFPAHKEIRHLAVRQRKVYLLEHV